MRRTKSEPRCEETPPEFFSSQVRRAQRFYLNLKPPRRHPLSVVCGGREQCGPNYAVQRSDFPYYSLEFVARGRGTLKLAGRDVPLGPGVVFTYGPGVEHEMESHAGEPLVKYFVDFTGRRAAPFLKQLDLTSGAVGRVFAPGELQSVFDDLVQNGLKNTRFSLAICEAIVTHLLLKTAELLLPGFSSQTQAFMTYQHCRRHIQANCEQLRSVAEIARQCHLDAAYLCRLFQRFDHQTPYQFLMRAKMNAAASRLQDPDVLVKQVAMEMMFDDAGHFSRSFKGVFGLSPEAFRRLR